MATITFEMAKNDVARFLSYFAECSGEPTIRVRVRLARRARDEHQTINLVWELEMLQDNGGIYRILLEGGQDE